MHNENSQKSKQPPPSGMVLVQLEDFRRLEEKQDEILNLLKSRAANSSDTGEYITEEQAKDIFPRGSTWFWMKRKAGLPFKKVGQTVYYKRADLQKLIDHE
jgi:hypothetical protein